MIRIMSYAVAVVGFAVIATQPTHAGQTRQPQSQGQPGQSGQNSGQPPVQGQLPPSPDALRAPATLNEENLSKVAAGAEDIIKVLQDDSGMMVELKKWIATNASNHGQIVEEDDLTDDAVTERVRKDLEFRGVATRLLQRYGYLLPKFNPGSQAELSEQIRRRAEILAFQRAEAERNNPSDREETTQTRENQQNRGAQFQGAPDNFGTSPSDQLLPNLPLQRSPANGVPLNPNVLRTTSASTDMSGTQDIRNAAALFGMNPDMTANTLSNDRSSVASLNQELLERSTVSSDGQDPNRSMYGTPNSQRNDLASRGNAPSTSNDTRRDGSGAQPGTSGYSSASNRRDRNEMEFEPKRSPAETVIEHVANPFYDIPSQYDLYQRVSARPAVLKPFGAEALQTRSEEVSQLPTDLPVGPDYIVGPGDGLYVDMYGSYSQRVPRAVDRQGRVDLPEVGPVMVAGKSLGEVQTIVQTALRSQFRNISADVSLARLRTVRVYIVGEVQNPGAYDVSSLSTAVNALIAAGGPTPNASLRHVKHMREGQLVEDVDVYNLLLRGVTTDVKRIDAGDTLLVQPAGPRVMVEGMVRRPAIYELRDETNLAQVLEMAGGVLPTASLKRIEVERVEAHEKKTILNLDVDVADEAKATKQLADFKMADGDHVHILSIAPGTQNAVYLQGHVLRPGKYSYKDGMRVTDLVTAYTDLMPEPDSYGEIVRLAAPDFRPEVESFNLATALADPANAPKLAALDTVRIYSKYDFVNVPTVMVGGEVRKPGTYRTTGQVKLKDAIFEAGGVTQDASLESAQLISFNSDGTLRISTVDLGKALSGDPVANLVLQPRDRLIVQRNKGRVDPAGVAIRGEVSQPGQYPLTTNLTVADLIQLGGGLKRSAYTGSADITRYLTGGQSKVTGEHVTIDIAKAMEGDPANNLTMRDGDVLTISRVSGWDDRGASVTIAGEVTHPGTFGIKPGERLSSVLKRAGYLLPTAYPQGTIFERRDVKALQEKSVKDLIARIEQQSTDVKVSLNSSASEAATLAQAANQQRDRVVQALRNATISGRMVVHIPVDMKNFVGTNDDIQLRAGDTLYIPKRPEFVIVSGQVYNANALTFQPRKTVGWYLSQAGGITPLGEKKGIFVIRADGSVVSGRGTDWWGRSVMSVRINPGDNIVVPEKPLGGSTFWRNFIGVAQVIESGAIGASALRSAGL
jgi:polysaccharide export outer membrane protein